MSEQVPTKTNYKFEEKLEISPLQAKATYIFEPYLEVRTETKTTTVSSLEIVANAPIFKSIPRGWDFGDIRVHIDGDEIRYKNKFYKSITRQRKAFDKLRGRIMSSHEQEIYLNL